MVRNFISREADVLKIYKTLIRLDIEYCSQAWTLVSRYGKWSVILRLKGTKKSDKNNEKIKRLQLG